MNPDFMQMLMQLQGLGGGAGQGQGQGMDPRAAQMLMQQFSGGQGQSPWWQPSHGMARRAPPGGPVPFMGSAMGGLMGGQTPKGISPETMGKLNPMLARMRQAMPSFGGQQGGGSGGILGQMSSFRR